MDRPVSVQPIRFGEFQLDARTGELRAPGSRVVLQDQPRRILLRLLEQPGGLVTRDELRRELWPADTFVDFEHGLNAAIKRLRDALGDAADAPRFVETLPRRGYRFVAPVETGSRSDDRGALHARGMRRLHRWAPGATALAAAAVVGMGLLQLRRQPLLTGRDTILIADFVNRTGEEVFDGTLRQGLAVQLEQSPFLSVISRVRVANILREMTKPANTPIVEEVAREVCQRSGAAVTINGSIARLGGHYVVGLEAIQCDSGSRVADEQIEVANREHVLEGLGRAATDLRQRLGESRSTLEHFNTSLPEATTASLDALKMFSIAEATRAHEGELRAEPLYRRAIELDPEFALAYAKLSPIYTNTGHGEAMKRVEREAYSRRDRVTEHERLYIDTRHCVIEPGAKSRDCYVSLNETWIRTYPRDASPHINLCRIYNDEGEFSTARQYCDAAVRLDPDNYMPYSNLVRVYVALDRFDEALKTSDEALKRRMSAAQFHEFRFIVGFVRHDAELMAGERAALAGHPEEYRVAGREAEAAMFEGRFRSARSLILHAEQVGPELADFRVQLRMYANLVEAAAGVAACHDGSDSLERPQASGPSAQAAVAALLCGDRRRAEMLLEAWRDTTSEAGPPLLGPARALLALEAGKLRSTDRLAPPAARDVTPATRYRPPYVRGIIYLRAGEPVKATAEFQRITDHRGVDPTSGLYPLAWVQQARAYRLAGDRVRARRAYEQFFALWKDADPDVPILIQAKSEYDRLSHRTS